MFLSARNVFSKNDTAWDNYLGFIKFHVPDIIYTIDGSLNDRVTESDFLYLNTLDELVELKAQLPNINSPQYYQLAINMTEEAIPR